MRYERDRIVTAMGRRSIVTGDRMRPGRWLRGGRNIALVTQTLGEAARSRPLDTDVRLPVVDCGRSDAVRFFVLSERGASTEPEQGPVARLSDGGSVSSGVRARIPTSASGRSSDHRQLGFAWPHAVRRRPVLTRSADTTRADVHCRDAGGRRRYVNESEGTSSKGGDS